MHFRRSNSYNTARNQAFPIRHPGLPSRETRPIRYEHFLKVCTEACTVHAVFLRRKRHSLTFPDAKYQGMLYDTQARSSAR